MTQTMTITEALAELKTINSRLAKKRSYVLLYLHRVEALKDPLATSGGSPEIIKRERQAIGDLEQRAVNVRIAIQRANARTMITIQGETKSIVEWLTWRRDVAPGQKQFLGELRAKIEGVRKLAQQRGVSIRAEETAGAKPEDIIVNISETQLAADIEALEVKLGTLDGQLSLKNATVNVEL